MGAIAFMTVFLGIPGLIIWGLHKLATKYGPGIEARRRDREIETGIRYGMYDAEAAERIARKIRDERDE
ncbi:hypothetical protein ACIQBJ_32065 [Kitasatospora sp. NPDC088391]|uniref:hypothetical protein n=1 Tax=Kitasatospora sp. NPDC088391 TaxID=3364074 RepID=UPI003813567E